LHDVPAMVDCCVSFSDTTFTVSILSSFPDLIETFHGCIYESCHYA
jgi:hypothetical protein